MQFDVTTKILNPATELNDPAGRFPRGNNIVYAFATASRRPDFYGYENMIEASYSMIDAFIKKLIDLGYRPYLFLVGASLTLKMVEDIPHYDLWAKAEKCGLKSINMVVEDLFVGDRRRRLGLYGIRAEDILTACYYQSQANACVIALSRNRDFLSRKTLSKLYKAAQPNDAARVIDLRWYDFIGALCGAGDVLLQEHGLFDDLERSLTLCMAASTWAALS